MYSSDQVHVPAFTRRQIFANDSPGRTGLSSGIDTSIGTPAWARSHIRVGAIVCSGVVEFVSPAVDAGWEGLGVNCGVFVWAGSVGISVIRCAEVAVRMAETVAYWGATVVSTACPDGESGKLHPVTPMSVKRKSRALKPRKFIIDIFQSHSTRL